MIGGTFQDQQPADLYHGQYHNQSHGHDHGRGVNA